MHKYFAEWYRAAGLEPKADDLETRWTALEGFAKNIKVRNGLELVRIYFSRTTQAEDFMDRYAASFQEADKNFPMRDNGLELQVLSAATIAHIVETTRTETTDAIALAVLCGSCKGLRSDLLNSEIVDYARSYLINESSKVREAAKTFQVKAPDVDLKDLLEKLATAAGGGAGTLKEPIKPPFEKLAEAVSTLSSSVNRMGQSIAKEISARREESDILWWVFGEYSRDLNQPMSGIPLTFATLVAGKELADLVKLTPGPLAARAYLDKMLRFVDKELSTKISIKDAINAAPNDWRKRLLDERNAESVDDLCPIHLGTAKSLESDRPASWPAVFDKSTGLKSRTSLAPLDLASQVYDEKLLMRAVSNAG